MSWCTQALKIMLTCSEQNRTQQSYTYSPHILSRCSQSDFVSHHIYHYTRVQLQLSCHVYIPTNEMINLKKKFIWTILLSTMYSLDKTQTAHTHTHRWLSCKELPVWWFSCLSNIAIHYLNKIHSLPSQLSIHKMVCFYTHTYMVAVMMLPSF